MSGEGQLPDGWAWTTLGNVAEVVGGVTKDIKKQADPTFVEVPYLRVANVQRGALDLTKVSTIRAPEQKIRQLALQRGDLLLNEGGDRDKLGRGWIWEEQIPGPVIHQNHVFRARVIAKVILPRFLALYVNALGRPWFEAHATQSVNLASISLSKIKLFPLPVPPLAEQHRIVEFLEEQLSRLDAAAKSLGSAQAKLTNFHRSIHTKALFGAAEQTHAKAGPSRDHILSERARLYSAADKRGRPDPLPPRPWEPINFPKHWTVCSLEEVTHPTRTISYGILMPGPDQVQGVPYVRVVNMRGDRIDEKNLLRTTSEIDEKYARARLTPGDVLVSIRGTYGRVCLVPHTLSGANITQDTARLAFLDLIDPQFACIYLRSSQAQQYFRAVARGVAVKGVNIGDLRGMPFPVPSLAEQRQIVQHVDTLISEYEAAVSATEHGIARVSRLRAAILQQAFEGKLMPQDPADEPASELLARTDAERANLATDKAKSAPRARTTMTKARPPKKTTTVPVGIQEELPL